MPSQILLDMPAHVPFSGKNGIKSFKPSCEKCSNGNKVTISFPDGDFTFHSQWLHDARCDDGASRNTATAICTQADETVRFDSVEMSTNQGRTTLNVIWNDGLSSKFPVEWLRVMAPIVASKANERSDMRTSSPDQGWTVDSLDIPKISYKEVFDTETEPERYNPLLLTILDHLLAPTSTGIVRVVDLPEPNFEDELNHVNNLNTILLKKIFGSVFIHPARGGDRSFNVSSRSKEAEKRKELPNYDTSQVLLPHADHAFYEQPIQVQGWYILEGESENTFVSVLAALKTLKEEYPESYHHLCNDPMTLGRVSAFYGESVSQMTVDTAIDMQPGTTDQFKRVRWHPNFIGSLLTPYEEYNEARFAQKHFLEIMRRDTHQLKINLHPGDMFIWNNYRVLHGREQVFAVPRTGVGQTVPEQVVHDKYRAICVDILKGSVDPQWLVHMPMPQLREMVGLVQENRF